jgi:hypothetical protein
MPGTGPAPCRLKRGFGTNPTGPQCHQNLRALVQVRELAQLLVLVSEWCLRFEREPLLALALSQQLVPAVVALLGPLAQE